MKPFRERCTRPTMTAATLAVFILFSLPGRSVADEEERLSQPPPQYTQRFDYQPQNVTATGPVATLFAGWKSIEGGGSGCAQGGAKVPDPHGAVGPRGILGCVNRSLGYFRRDGSPFWRVGTADFMMQLGGTGGSGDFVDMRCLYDAASERFFIVAIDDPVGGYYTSIAVSKTSDPTTFTPTSWYFYHVYSAETVAGIPRVGDYPSIGVDHQCLYVSLNMFPAPLGSDFTFLNVEVLCFDKLQLCNGIATFTRVNTPEANGDPGKGFTLQPASLVGSADAGNVGYLAEIPYNDDSQVRLWAIADPLGAPVLTSVPVAIPSNGGGFGSYPGAPQLGTYQQLDTVSPRAMNNVFWRDGSLWLCCTAGYLSLHHAAVFYYELSTNGYPAGTPTLATSGSLDAGDAWRFMPAIAGNERGDVCLVFTQSSATTYPTVMASIQRAGTQGFPEPVVVQQSPTFFNPGAGDYSCQNWQATFFGRWGDYGVAAVDPLDGSFWVSHECSAEGPGNFYNLWRVVWGNVQIPIATAWQPDGIPVRNGDARVVTTRVADDAAGGAIVAWTEYREFDDPRVFVSRLTPAGGTADGWPVGGTRLESISPSAEAEVHVTADGNGGAYVTYLGYEGLALQHLTSQGNVSAGWPASGVTIGDGRTALPVSDGDGGVVVGWVDTNDDLRTQRFSSAGIEQWPSGGILAGAEVGELDLSSDQAGGVLAAWVPAAHVQHITSAGGLPWGSAGTPLGVNGLGPRVVTDGAGGALVAYVLDLPATTNDPVYAMRVGTSGTAAPGWTLPGVMCAPTSHKQSQPALVADGSGGALIAWTDLRTSPSDIYAQRVTGSGLTAPGWPASGAAVCTAAGTQSAARLVADESGGALITWDDSRGVYCLHLNGTGDRDASYPQDGLAVCTAQGDQRFPGIARTATGTAVLVWADGRTCRSGCVSTVYAQRQYIDPSLLAVASTGQPWAMFATSPFPNPARESAQWQLAIPASLAGKPLAVDVFDLTGRRVRSLVDQTATPGAHSLAWDLRDASGLRVRPGLFLVRMRLDERRETARLMVIR